MKRGGEDRKTLRSVIDTRGRFLPPQSGFIANRKAVLSAVTSHFNSQASLQIFHACWIYIIGFDFFLIPQFAIESLYFCNLSEAVIIQRNEEHCSVCFFSFCQSAVLTLMGLVWAKKPPNPFQHFTESCLYHRSSFVGYFCSCTHTHTHTRLQQMHPYAPLFWPSSQDCWPGGLLLWPWTQEVGWGEASSRLTVLHWWHWRQYFVYFIVIDSSTKYGCTHKFSAVPSKKSFYTASLFFLSHLLFSHNTYTGPILSSYIALCVCLYLFLVPFCLI